MFLCGAFLPIRVNNVTSDLVTTQKPILIPITRINNFSLTCSS